MQVVSLILRMAILFVGKLYDLQKGIADDVDLIIWVIKAEL